MSCLIQALLPKSVAERLDAAILHSPDNHGGFEMGTWCYSCYLGVFRRAIESAGLPSVEDNEQVRVGAHYESGQPGYWLKRVYTAPERVAIVKALKTMKSKRVKKTGAHPTRAYLYQFDLKEPNPFSDGMIIPKWHRYLIRLMSGKDDVVWYSI